jgi:hypothetical protein
METWHGWHKMPTGSTQTAPAASGDVDAFARGDDHVVYNNATPGRPENWSDWRPLGGLTTSLAPATTRSYNKAYAFATSDDGRIFYTQWNDGAASGWQEIPGGESTPSSPGVAPGIIVVRRSDGRIRFNTYDNDGPILSWLGWQDVPDGGQTPSAPAIADFGIGYFLLIRGQDDRIYNKYLSSDLATWGEWSQVAGGGITFDAPAAAGGNGPVAAGPGGVGGGMASVRGTDNKIYCNIFRNNNWGGWQSVQGGTYSAPALTCADDCFTLMARGTDNGIHYAFYN